MASRSKDGLPKLEVQVGLGADGEAEVLADATIQLRRELLELDVEAVEVARARVPPPGTRAVDFVSLGALVVTLANSGLVNGVVAAIRSGLGRQPDRSIGLGFDGDVLELTGISCEKQRRLADAWPRRHVRRLSRRGP